MMNGMSLPRRVGQKKTVGFDLKVGDRETESGGKKRRKTVRTGGIYNDDGGGRRRR